MGAIGIPQGGWKIANYKQPERVLLGFEYEIDTRQRSLHLNALIAETLPNHYSWAFENIDHNNNYGYEIKSSVAPLMRIKSEIRSIWSIICSPINNTGQNNGGIHVNVNRNEYTTSVYKKVFTFLHNPANEAWLMALSGRENRSFKLFSPCNVENDWDHYYGIITTRKTFAFEFRMFRANPELLIPANEFIHALFELAGRIETELTTENVLNFLSSFKRYASIYPLYQVVVTRH